jgi:asparagine synthase (glutamine-hydrolysing)
MCGICGAINLGNEVKIKEMTSLIKHRGPDDHGVLEISNNGNKIFLGNTRLSIIDLSSLGHMPMQTADKRFSITYNGECYNFADIRKILINQGVLFNSHTDSEVILKAYAKWGIEAINMFDGMYAIAIWDNYEQELILIRDRAGIKPLYYYHDGRKFAFASEIKSLLALDEIKREPNLTSLILMAGFFWSPDPLTAFDNIHRLKPAHYLIYKKNEIKINRYWKPVFNSNYYNNLPDAVDDFDNIFIESIKSNLISDVPIGAFVGGLDSSLIGILSNKYHNGEFPFYTSTMTPETQQRENRPDDLPFVKSLIEGKGIDLYVHNISDVTAKYLPKMIWHLDEPSADPLHIQMYLMSELARENGSKVLLCGQGADELFLGYERHRAMLYAEKLNSYFSPGFNSVINFILSSLPVASGEKGISILRKSKRFFKSANYGSLERFVYLYLFPRIDDLKNISPVWADYVDPALALMIEKHKSLWDEIEADDIKTKMSYTDTLLYLHGYNLFYSDKSSSAASIEARYPFLNKDVMEFAFRIKSDWKINKGVVKYILKKTAERHMPNENIYRKKIAFPGALRSWTRVEWYEKIKKILMENKSGLWDLKYLGTVLGKNKSGKYDYAHFIWALVMIELWYRIFILNNKSEIYKDLGE